MVVEDGMCKASLCRFHLQKAALGSYGYAGPQGKGRSLDAYVMMWVGPGIRTTLATLALNSAVEAVG